MELSISAKGKTSGKLTVSDDIFGSEYNEALVHQIIVAYLAKRRQGDSAQKNRSAVRGGGIKPHAQKGTGRARAGTIRSPLWRSGGVTFASKKRDYSQKVNKKMYKSAVRSILSELVRKERLKVVKTFDLKEPKTKLLKSMLDELKLENTLIVTKDKNDNLSLAGRNIPNVSIVESSNINPYALMQHANVVFTSDAISHIEERFA